MKNNTEMLKELIELAENNNFKFWNVNQGHIEFIEDEMIWQYEMGHSYYASVTELLFNHDFAKACFEEGTVIIPANFIGEAKSITIWQHHLQQLAITKPEYRIKYAWENRRK